MDQDRSLEHEAHMKKFRNKNEWFAKLEVPGGFVKEGIGLGLWKPKENRKIA